MSSTGNVILRDEWFLIIVFSFYKEHYGRCVDGFIKGGRVLQATWLSMMDTKLPLRLSEAFAR
jgi:hypothetical protein